MTPADSTCIHAATLSASSHCLPPAMRAMTQAYHALEQFSSRHIRRLGLTSAQFSVLLALSAGPAVSCKALSAQTAITKGSLTGVLDRLTDKGWVRRGEGQQDRRSHSVLLTDEGRATFARVADQHFACLQRAFAAFPADELARMETSLCRFHELFNH